jgi:hypothetical protein
MGHSKKVERHPGLDSGSVKWIPYLKPYGMTYMNWVILGLLVVGLVYRILLTSGGNFIFHIDNARDMLDVRDMVVLHHPRLIGPTTGIDGLFLGPGWYYLLAIPFILSGGAPYAEVLLMDFFWLIGGFFLLKMLVPRGILALILGGFLWIVSSYLVLATMYSFSPNPIILLTPLLIYLMANYLDRGKLIDALKLGGLCAFFWNLEMAFAIYLPFMILAAICLSKKFRFFIHKPFWLGIVLPFFLGMIFQILFELRHNFFMTRNVLGYLTQHKSSDSTFSLTGRIIKTWATYKEAFNGTFMNQDTLIILGVGLLLVLVGLLIWRKMRFDTQILAAFVILIVPFIGFSFMPLVIQLWHIEASVTVVIFLIAVAISGLQKINGYAMVLSGLLVLIVGIFSVQHLELPGSINPNRPISDPSIFKYEIAAIDWGYQQAQGKNFKAYVYSPGILDLPYQYNFWWYGQRKYGYLPEEYAYLPKEPPYIKDKQAYSNGNNPPDSGLVVLIKEPGFPQREDLWKNSFTSLESLKSDTMGPLRLELRQSLHPTDVRR